VLAVEHLRVLQLLTRLVEQDLLQELVIMETEVVWEQVMYTMVKAVVQLPEELQV
jgi:hypothetical protein